MRIVLISPRIPPAAMNFQHTMPLISRQFSHIPLQLATVAACTPQGHDVEIIDENVEAIPPTIVADVVAFTGIFCQGDRLVELARRFRSAKTLIVVGGPIASDMRETMSLIADTLILGEAENTWPRFITELESGTAKPEYRSNSWSDMHESPIPRFDLLKLDRYSAGCVQATRGCPYRCDYCDVPVKQGRRPRSKRVAQVIEEVRIQVEAGLGSIFFVDDHFAGDRKYAVQLLEALAEYRRRAARPVYFYTQVTVNVGNDAALLAKFRAAGFRRFFVGIESPNKEHLRSVNKHHNADVDMHQCISNIQQSGITVWAGVMLGVNETDASFVEDQLAFIDDTAIMPTLVGLLQAMPDTEVHRRASDEGRLRVVNNIVSSSAIGSAEAMADSNVDHFNLTDAELLRAFVRIVRTIYAPERYADRLLRMTAKAPLSRIDWKAILTRDNIETVARVTRYYLTAEPDLRAMYIRVMSEVIKRNLQGFEEIAYHLAIYKHLREFYSEAASRAELRGDLVNAMAAE